MTTIPKIEIRKPKTVIAADMWCGGGGTSTGLVGAVSELGLNLELTAVNHWEIAVATHSTNHPNARHFCKAVDSINPLDLYAGKRLHLLVASPECVHHSRARGGKPRDEQKRADAWDLQRWIEKLYIENLLIENVREFVDWGPLKADGTPDKRHKGKYFNQFIDFLKILYSVEWRVLNCADYGDATTRERFFLIARRPKGKKITFPAPTHASRKVLAKKQPDLFGGGELKPWRSAREIIDWTLPGKSIFGRKKPLSENTMKRIYAGLMKYSLKPFVMGTGGPTGQQRPRSVDDPVPTITANYEHYALAEPFIVGVGGAEGQRKPHDINEPLKTVTGTRTFAAVEPFIVPFAYGSKNGKSDERSYPIGEPLKTITGVNNWTLIEPYLVKFKNNQDGQSIDDPLQTLTTKDCYGLCIPQIGAVLDIRFRMLQPKELAAAMSFPENYHFAGTRDQQVKQIGNAVPCQTAKALCKAILEN